MYRYKVRRFLKFYGKDYRTGQRRVFVFRVNNLKDAYKLKRKLGIKAAFYNTDGPKGKSSKKI